MSEPRYRVLVICSHPIQYMAPLLRHLSQHPQLDVKAAYCSLKGVQSAFDPEFNTTVQWDVPLLEGYDWQEVKNRGSGSESFFGYYNPGLLKLIRTGNFQAVFIFVSYRSASFWIAYLASRISGTAFIFGTDASHIAIRGGGDWKLRLKKLAWPWLFSMADQVIVPGTTSREMMLSLRIPPERITVTPSSVDNDWWQSESAKVDRSSVRKDWGAEPSSVVVLFCAKLQPWKCPLELLRAFASVRTPQALLVFAGEGPQRAELEREAASLGVSGQVRFLGFINQSRLPAVYAAADLMVLPSEYEPFGLVVNEACSCACPAVVSDRVGAARDLVAPVNPAFIYPFGDTKALAGILRGVFANPGELGVFGRAAQQRMASWSYRDTVAGFLQAIRSALQHRKR